MRPTFDMDALRTMVVGSFARAAAQLGRSQSAVSMQLRKLEQQAGGPLFRRNGRFLAPTEAGDSLLAYARRIIALNDEAAASLGATVATASVRIGLPQDFVEDLIPEAIVRFARQRPGVHVEVRAGRNYALEEVRAGRLDVALGFFDPGLEFARPARRLPADALAGQRKRREVSGRRSYRARPVRSSLPVPAGRAAGAGGQGAPLAIVVHHAQPSRRVGCAARRPRNFSEDHPSPSSRHPRPGRRARPAQAAVDRPAPAHGRRALSRGVGPARHRGPGGTQGHRCEKDQAATRMMRSCPVAPSSTAVRSAVSFAERSWPSSMLEIVSPVRERRGTAQTRAVSSSEGGNAMPMPAETDTTSPKYLRDKYAIVGVGETTYTRGSGHDDARAGHLGGAQRHRGCRPEGRRRRRHAVLPVGQFDLLDLHRGRPRHPAQLLHGRVRRRLVDRGADRHGDGRDRSRHVQDRGRSSAP